MAKKPKKKNLIWKKEVPVLGTVYKIFYEKKGKKYLDLECDGYTTWDLKEIHVCSSGCKPYDRKVMRHEVLHAFMFESGYFGNENPRRKENIHDEQIIDFWSVQLPKVFEVFKELEILD